MSLTVPPAKNYQSPLIPIVSTFGREPKEGRQQVPIALNWTVDGAQNGTSNQYAVHINLQNNNTLAFSQISAIKVDNSQSGADVQFVFVDTQEIITVPAYEPCAIVPAFTGAKQFYAVASGAIPGDVTRMQVLNFVPPPVTVPEAIEQNAAGQVGLVIGSNMSQNFQLVPAGVNGTVQSLNISFSILAVPAAPATINFFVFDGQAPNNFLVNGISLGGIVSGNWPVLEWTDVRLRFVNGLTAKVITNNNWAGGGFANFLATYRTP